MILPPLVSPFLFALSLLSPGNEPAVSSTANASPATGAKQDGLPAMISFGDVDGDGLEEALSISALGQVALLRNLGDGKFTDITRSSGLAGVEFATCALFTDFDGDGTLDLFLGSSGERLWRNLGGGEFAAFQSNLDHDLVDFSAWSIDADQDGFVDLHLRTEAGDLVYRNLGEGIFELLAITGADIPMLPGALAGVNVTTLDPGGTGEGAAIDTATSARRRLNRWLRANQGPSSFPSSSSASSGFSATSIGVVGTAGAASSICAGTIEDQAGGSCIEASSVPTLGMLYPLSNDFNISAIGNIGLGTTNPLKKLHVKGPDEVGIFLEGDDPNFTMRNTSGTPKDFQFLNRNGEFFLRDNGVPRLTVRANGTVSIKETLEIRGGADIVERFDAGQVVEPGTVVVIDPKNPGKLMLSRDAYDAKVAGVVSGAGGVNPGLCLSQDGTLDGETLVAMNGRVYVKATAHGGAIQPGDLLTTADLTGHAMKATDHAKAFGSVIGKAMSSLESGEGLVLVLVNLQ